tara:strand:- start:411 stop:1388 length:978 start_codon:yes stop_codon:yes gene_type:complete
MKKIFLHVGQYKTGTTALQKYLLENIQYLEKHGIFFCSAKRYFNSQKFLFPNGSLYFGMNFIDKRPIWIDYKKDEIDAIYEKTLQDIENTICPNVLISTEHLFDTTTEKLEKLRDSLSAISNEVYVIIYLRDLIPYVNSSFIQRVSGGNNETDSYELFLKRVVEKSELQYDYYVNLKRFETVFSKKKLIVKHFGSNLYGGNIVKDFFQILGKEVVKTAQDENRNPSATAAECFRRFNRAYSGKQDINKIRNFMNKNIEKFQFGTKSFVGANSASLLKKKFQKDHKKITDEYDIPLSFKIDNLQAADLKISIEERDEFLQKIKHLL